MLDDLKEELAREARYLAQQGLVAGREGNLSVRRADNVVIKGTGVRMLDASPADFSVVDLSGRHIEGPRPSSEVRMHLGVYGARPDAGAIVHVHPAYTLSLAALGIRPEPYTEEARLYYDRVCAVPRLPPGSLELASAVASVASSGCSAILLEGHGLVFVARDLKDAVDGAVAEERSSQVQFMSAMSDLLQKIYLSCGRSRGPRGGGRNLAVAH
ncbi:MAG: class II aldolase/adducin family protein [Conexivisphaera sp.]